MGDALAAPLRYWYPACRVCKQPKGMSSSHCETHTCPWCAECAGRKP